MSASKYSQVKSTRAQDKLNRIEQILNELPRLFKSCPEPMETEEPENQVRLDLCVYHAECVHVSALRGYKNMTCVFCPIFKCSVSYINAYHLSEALKGQEMPEIVENPADKEVLERTRAALAKSKAENSFLRAKIAKITLASSPQQTKHLSSRDLCVQYGVKAEVIWAACNKTKVRLRKITEEQESILRREILLYLAQRKLTDAYGQQFNVARGHRLTAELLGRAFNVCPSTIYNRAKKECFHFRDQTNSSINDFLFCLEKRYGGHK